VARSSTLTETATLLRCFAQEGVSQPSGGTQALITKQDAARLAVANLLLTNTPQKKHAAPSVVGIRDAGIKDVYCLTVSDHGCFSLGGSVVSNCDSVGYFVHWTMPINKPVLVTGIHSAI